jgi:membrane fusion protein (multidrug efflux system)
MKRKLRSVAIVLVTVATGFVVGSWVRYRYTHVLASYAFVKGAVVQVGTPIEGQIASIEVRPGQRVRQGDVIARLNDVKQRANVEEARAVLEEAAVQVGVEREAVKVLYKKAQVMSHEASAKMAVIEAEARAADIDVLLASRQAERSAALRERDMVSQADNDVASTTRDLAEERVEHAKGKVGLAAAQGEHSALQEANAKAKEARLALLEARVGTARAALERAEAELELTVIRAAKSGIVSRRLVEPGAAVRMGGAVLEIWYDEELAIEAWIDESEYGSLAVGKPAVARLPGLDRPLPGHVVWLGVVTELELKDASFSISVAKLLARSHWVRARIALDHPDPALMPGLTAEVSIPRNSAPRWVPQLVPPTTEPQARTPATNSPALAGAVQ